MNKFMKKLMKKDGFTLVELIVVIAILAILAGVAIPAYSGYITKANEAVDQQVLEAIETAMSAALAMEGLDKDDAADYFVLTVDGKEITLEGAELDDDATNEVWKNFKDFYGKSTCVEEFKEIAPTTIYGVSVTSVASAKCECTTPVDTANDGTCDTCNKEIPTT